MPGKFRFLPCVLILLLVLACEKDTSNPRVELLNGTWLTKSTSIGPGGSLKFKWRVTRGKSDLASFTLRMDGQDLDRFPKNDIPVDEYIDSTYLEGPVVLGTYVYSFLATDADGNTGDKDIVVSVE